MTTATLQITGVDFVCVPTRDHDRAVDFYGDTLGLELRKRWGDMPATAHANTTAPPPTPAGPQPGGERTSPRRRVAASSTSIPVKSGTPISRWSCYQPAAWPSHQPEAGPRGAP
jgi:catechol 2,3-dioxygenase-like lactoylglutathione lyase family enzyme